MLKCLRILRNSSVLSAIPILTIWSKLCLHKYSCLLFLQKSFFKLFSVLFIHFYRLVLGGVSSLLVAIA